jgi:hypothetical protein
MLFGDKKTYLTFLLLNLLNKLYCFWFGFNIVTGYGL